MKKTCIITAASNKFFPSLINLLGSIASNYPHHPDVHVYDLGLAAPFRMELKQIPWVHIQTVPHFVPHWRTCYSWKTYILKTPLANLNLYMDAGCQVLMPLDHLFEKIEANGYLAISQGPTVTLEDISPQEFLKRYKVPPQLWRHEILTAGIVGFKCDSPIMPVLDKLYAAGIAGDCLGFSPTEQWKNKGVNKTDFVRNCKMFRHDTTLWSILFLTYIPNGIIEPVADFDNKIHSPHQYIFNLRLNYTALTYLDTHLLHARPTYIAYTNRVFIRIFIFLKKHANRFKNHRRVPAHTDPLSRIFGPLTTVIDETDKQPRESNIRYYHLLKGAHVFSFLKQYASPEKYFLDAGAGRGPYCMLASPLFKNVTCWEYNENELAHARKACARFSNISYARVDLRNTPAYDGSFDVIVCSEVLEHIPEREQAVRELRRLLRPGGTLLVSMPNSWSLFYLRVRIVHRALLKKKLSPGDPDWEFIQHLLFPFWKIEKLLKNGGFQIIRRSGVNILPISEKIRTRLTERYPKIAFIYLVIERSLSRICPFFCSFYFLTLQ